MSGVRYRTATRPEVDLALDWAAAEGWNPGLEDGDAFFATDPEGFFVADIDGVPVAAISVVNLSDSLAFLGLYLCQPDYRGQGLGYGLWQHAVDHAGDRTIGLDGVPAQQANYAKSGFVYAGQTRRFEGTVPALLTPARLATDADYPALVRLDRAAGGIDRPAFLSGWVADCPTRKTVVQAEGDQITAFATARLCREGCKVGPVIAPDAAQAYDLAVQAAGTLGQSRVMIDVAPTAPAFGDLLTGHGFTVSFATARMYRGTAPDTGPGLQAIATMELG